MADNSEFSRAAAKASLLLALTLPVATLLSLQWGSGLPLAVAGAGGLGALWLQLRRFGAPASHLPNAITTLRVLITTALLVLGSRLGGTLLAAFVLCVFALDGLDGHVARRTNGASLLGAHFDMESDAFLVMGVCLLHALAGVGGWVLLGGLARYGYVLTVHSLETRGEQPRSRLARYAFAISISLFALAFLPLGAPATLLAAAATGVLVISFSRSFYWSLRGCTSQVA